MITHEFAGYVSPLPKTVAKSGSTLPVKFTLADRIGTAVTRVELARTSGEIISASRCAYSATIRAYQCNLMLPKAAGSYLIWASEQIGGAWQLLPNAPVVSGKPNANPVTLTLK